MSSSRNHKFSSPDNNNEPWDHLIGEITSPQGLRGEVRAYPHTDFPERFNDLKEIGLRRDGQPVTVVKVQSARTNGRVIFLKIVGIDSITQAESLRGTQIVVPKSWQVQLDEDEYFYSQLIGLEVLTTTGEPLGKIIEIWPTGANDVYETPLALIPATKEMIREIDIDRGLVTVDDRPGLKKSDPGD